MNYLQNDTLPVVIQSLKDETLLFYYKGGCGTIVNCIN